MADKITQRKLREMARPPWIRAQGAAEVTSQGKDFNINVDRVGGQWNYPHVVPGIITSIGQDTVTCNLYDIKTDTSSTSIPLIAYKPFHLQRSLWNGSTITYENNDVVSYSYPSGVSRYRTATLDPSGSAISQTQEVAPDYFVGEVLLLAKLPTFSTADGVNNVSYFDLNIGAKTWAVAVGL